MDDTENDSSNNPLLPRERVYRAVAAGTFIEPLPSNDTGDTYVDTKTDGRDL
jgi:hypothetical protein